MVSVTMDDFSSRVKPSALHEILRTWPDMKRETDAANERARAALASRHPRNDSSGTWWVVLVYEPDTCETDPVHAHWCLSAEHAAETAEAYAYKGKSTITCTTRADMGAW